MAHQLRSMPAHTTSDPRIQELVGDRTERFSSIELDGEQYSVLARWQVIDGRAEPVLVSVFTNPPRPVTADAMRRLPLGTVLGWMRSDLAWEANFPGIEGDPRQPVRSAARSGPQRGRPWLAEDLEGVARLYRNAWLEGRPVTEAVANHFGVSKSTASKRIMAARKAGLLDGIGPKR